MKKFSLLLLSVLMALSFVACGDDDEVSTVNWSDVGSSTLRFKNMSNVDGLVVFKGSPGASGTQILGGVPAGAQDHGVTRVDGLYVVNVLKESEYKNNISNLANAKIAFSTLVFVDSQKVTYSISSGLAGTGVVRFVNNTEAYVEIRNMSKFGDTLTTLRPGEEKLQYMPEDDYKFYPVMKIEQRDTATIIGVYDKYLTKLIDYVGVSSTAIRFQVDDSAGAVEHVVAYVKVRNDTGKGCILNNGSVELKNSLGRSIINNGGAQYYTLEGSANGIAFSNLKLYGPTSEIYNIAPVTLTNGVRYTLSVTETNSSIQDISAAPDNVTTENSTW